MERDTPNAVQAATDELVDKTDAQWNPTAEELHEVCVCVLWFGVLSERDPETRERDQGRDAMRFHAKIEALDEAADREIGWVACRIAFRRWWLMNHDLESHAEQMICELICEEMCRDDGCKPDCRIAAAIDANPDTPNGERQA